MNIKTRYLRSVDKVLPKKYLNSELNQYKSLLSESSYSYLKELLNLEKSATISETEHFDPDNYHISELDIYRDIAIYNLYKRALKIFKSTGDELEIIGNSNGYQGLAVSTKIGDKVVDIYNFNYSNELNVDIFKTVMDDKNRKKVLESILSMIEELKQSKPDYGFTWNSWNSLKEERIKQLKELYTKVDRSEFTDDEYKEAEITQKYHKLLLEEYNTDESEIKEKNSWNGTTKKNSIIIPSLILTNNIKLI